MVGILQSWMRKDGKKLWQKRKQSEEKMVGVRWKK